MQIPHLRKTFLLFYFVLFSAQLYGGKQHSPDSLKNVLGSLKNKTQRLEVLVLLAEESHRTNPDLINDYLDEMHQLAAKEKNKQLASRAYLMLGKLEITKDNFEAGRKYIDKCMLYAKNYIDMLAEANDAYGALEDRLGNYDKAMSFHLKAIPFYEKLGDKQGMGNSYKYLGILQARQNNHKEALVYFLKSLELDREINNQFGLGQSLNNVGITYYSLGEKERALPYFRESIYYKELSKNRRGLGATIINLAEYHNYKKNYDSAMYFLNRCIALANEVQSNYQRATALLIRSDTWLGMKKPEKAIIDLEKSYEISNAIGLKLEKSKALKRLSDAYLLVGQPGKAVKSLQEYILIKDSLLNEENSRSLLQMQTKFQTEKKENEIKTLNKDKQINALRIKQLNADSERQKIINVVYIVVLLVVAVFAFFIYRSLQERKKANILLSEKNQLIEEKNREILDSINYAKRLQDAILPSEKFWKQQLPESFILYKPKDIVAGDFYFMQTAGDKLIFAVGDCTGHGVPGAMVSVVCSNALSRSIKEFGLTDPGKILDKTRELVLETFSVNESEVKDGMDISLATLTCRAQNESGERNDTSLSSSALTLSWAGANNPLWIINNDGLQEIKGDKQPIGQFESMKPFTTHHVSLSPHSTLFLFSDGYSDQFGGDKGKKLKASNLKKFLIHIHGLSVFDQKKQLHESFEKWKSGLEQVDDVCVIGVRI